MNSARLPPMALREQRGVFGILYAILLPVMLIMIGLAIDMSMLYARGREMQSVADGAALAAARALDGTIDGITRARQAADDRSAMAEYRFINARRINWSDDALSLGPTADGPWTAATAVSALDAPAMLYARVNTEGLDKKYGEVAMSFSKIINVAPTQDVVRSAVAGRRDTSLSPLAVCALNPVEISGRTGVLIQGAVEAVEFGFRRGVTYNLLRLNPAGTSARSFLVNPLDFPPAPSVASHHTDSAVRPFVCTGSMPAPPIANGSTLYVREPFPVSMIHQLNSRFNQYTGGSVCTPFIAPPDATLRDFRGPYTGFWMSNVTAPVRASADELNDGTRLVTVADYQGAVAGTTAASYGTLWSFGIPRRFANGRMETEFSRSHWKFLYPVASGQPPSSTYSGSVSPYDTYANPHIEWPVGRSGVEQRRVLNVALLECPVSGSSARVLGIGRFLMTTPATETPAGVYAEFGGLTTYPAMATSAVLIR